MGQGAAGGYARSNDHWITLATDGWKDGDIAWAHGGPGCRDALRGPLLWLLISDTADRVAVEQLDQVAKCVQQGGAALHAQLLAPSHEEAIEATAKLAAEAISTGQQAALFFRGDLLTLEAGWHSLTLGDVVDALAPELGHCRLVLASCSAGGWAFGGKKPWGPHGASHATSRHVELFCASQPIQCGFTCTVPELYVRWLLGEDRALETMAAVSQFPMAAVLALQTRVVK